MGRFRDSKCPRCDIRGKHTKCSRQVDRDVRAAARKGINANPHPCPRTHGGKVCGKTVRGGVCPCPDC